MFDLIPIMQMKTSLNITAESPCLVFPRDQQFAPVPFKVEETDEPAQTLCFQQIPWDCRQPSLSLQAHIKLHCRIFFVLLASLQRPFVVMNAAVINANQGRQQWAIMIVQSWVNGIRSDAVEENRWSVGNCSKKEERRRCLWMQWN